LRHCGCTLSGTYNDDMCDGGDSVPVLPVKMIVVEEKECHRLSLLQSFPLPTAVTVIVGAAFDYY